MQVGHASEFAGARRAIIIPREDRLDGLLLSIVPDNPLPVLLVGYQPPPIFLAGAIFHASCALGFHGN
jgi:hypothetical protein